MVLDYQEYLNSPEWAAKRNSRLEYDNYCCRLCDTCEKLQVHHRPSSYFKIPNESIENDLITLCSRCHKLATDSIQEDRHSKKHRKQKPNSGIIDRPLSPIKSMGGDSIRRYILFRGTTPPGKRLKEITIFSRRNKRRLTTFQIGKPVYSRIRGNIRRIERVWSTQKMNVYGYSKKRYFFTNNMVPSSVIPQKQISIDALARIWTK